MLMSRKHMCFKTLPLLGLYVSVVFFSACGMEDDRANGSGDVNRYELSTMELLAPRFVKPDQREGYRASESTYYRTLLDPAGENTALKSIPAATVSERVSERRFCVTRQSGVDYTEVLKSGVRFLMNIVSGVNDVVEIFVQNKDNEITGVNTGAGLTDSAAEAAMNASDYGVGFWGSVKGFIDVFNRSISGDATANDATVGRRAYKGDGFGADNSQLGQSYPSLDNKTLCYHSQAELDKYAGIADPNRRNGALNVIALEEQRPAARTYPSGDTREQCPRKRAANGTFRSYNVLDMYLDKFSENGESYEARSSLAFSLDKKAEDNDGSGYKSIVVPIKVTETVAPLWARDRLVDPTGWKLDASVFAEATCNGVKAGPVRIKDDDVGVITNELPNGSKQSKLREFRTKSGFVTLGNEALPNTTEIMNKLGVETASYIFTAPRKLSAEVCFIGYRTDLALTVDQLMYDDGEVHIARTSVSTPERLPKFYRVPADIELNQYKQAAFFGAVTTYADIKLLRGAAKMTGGIMNSRAARNAGRRINRFSIPFIGKNFRWGSLENLLNVRSVTNGTIGAANGLLESGKFIGSFMWAMSKEGAKFVAGDPLKPILLLGGLSLLKGANIGLPDALTLFQGSREITDGNLGLVSEVSRWGCMIIPMEPGETYRFMAAPPVRVPSGLRNINITPQDWGRIAKNFISATGSRAVDFVANSGFFKDLVGNSNFLQNWGFDLTAAVQQTYEREAPAALLFSFDHRSHIGQFGGLDRYREIYRSLDEFEGEADGVQLRAQESSANDFVTTYMDADATDAASDMAFNSNIPVDAGDENTTGDIDGLDLSSIPVSDGNSGDAMIDQFQAVSDEGTSETQDETSTTDERPQIQVDAAAAAAARYPTSGELDTVFEAFSSSNDDNVPLQTDSVWSF